MDELIAHIKLSAAQGKAIDIGCTNKDFSFTGKSAAVRTYKDGKVVVLNNEGAATFTIAGQRIQGRGPFRVTMNKGKVLAVPLHETATVTVTPEG